MLIVAAELDVDSGTDRYYNVEATHCVYIYVCTNAPSFCSFSSEWVLFVSSTSFLFHVCYFILTPAK